MDAHDDLDALVEGLYAAHPAGFTAARKAAAARARTAGDPEAARRIAALRRPTLAAWASNVLVRAKEEEVEQFLQLGQALREAHRSLDGEQLRELSHQQHVVIGALAREAVRLAREAGTKVSGTVEQEVEQILRAVLADPDTAREWASGRLERVPEPVTRFPEADPGAVPPPSGRRTAPDAREDRDAREAREAAARAADAAARALVEAEEELRTAEEVRRSAVARATAADATLARLEAESQRARAERDLAYEAVERAEARHGEARAHRRSAARAAGAADG
ncbi:hypothetical protein [Streptomyces sp. NPDC048606]|uniref:hypothetical protein n=1 Tax=Streptomyces sp. NPDC048606 TaxID=3154726 RepID=UPI00343328FE